MFSGQKSSRNKKTTTRSAPLPFPFPGDFRSLIVKQISNEVRKILRLGGQGKVKLELEHRLRPKTALSRK